MWIATVRFPLRLKAELTAGHFAAVASLGAGDPKTASPSVSRCSISAAPRARAAFQAAAADPALARCRDGRKPDSSILRRRMARLPSRRRCRGLVKRIATGTPLAARAFHLLAPPNCA